jgi:hypothetical protein
MEAATGAAPATAEGQPQGDQNTEAQPQEQGVDIAEWQRTVDQQLSSSNDTMRQIAEMNQSILSRLPEPQAEAEPDFDQQYQELFEQGGGYVDPAQLQSLMQQHVQQQVQQAVGPLQEQWNAMQQEMTARDLEGLQTEFPELAEAGAADTLATAVVDQAMSMLPPGSPPEVADSLMQNKNFVRLVHLAEKAKSRAQQETPAGGTTQMPQIETGGGAAPTSTSGEDEWDKFVASRRPSGGSVW